MEKMIIDIDKNKSIEAALAEIDGILKEKGIPGFTIAFMFYQAAIAQNDEKDIISFDYDGNFLISINKIKKGRTITHIGRQFKYDFNLGTWMPAGEMRIS